MSVYMIGQVTIKNPDEYWKYAELFMGVFEKFDGKVLSVEDNPKNVSGEWTASRSILLEFPDKTSWKAWISSPEYQKIAEHRIAGADVNAILVNSLDHQE
ncbi:MAG: DUF1330 domain-containing protein [Hellea sp.]|nr:DUF1330 domain-containing protein [Hellea sp.]